jgi:hypothetical protein
LIIESGGKLASLADNSVELSSDDLMSLILNLKSKELSQPMLMALSINPKEYCGI